MIMDHSSDSDVQALFERVDKEQNGQLDILVNNAYAGKSGFRDHNAFREGVKVSDH